MTFATSSSLGTGLFGAVAKTTAPTLTFGTPALSSSTGFSFGAPKPTSTGKSMSYLVDIIQEKCGDLSGRALHDVLNATLDSIIYKSKYKKVGVLPIRIVWSNVSSIGPSSERMVSL